MIGEHTLPATGLGNSAVIGPRFYAWFVVFVLLIFPLHESAQVLDREIALYL